MLRIMYSRLYSTVLNDNKLPLLFWVKRVNSSGKQGSIDDSTPCIVILHKGRLKFLVKRYCNLKKSMIEYTSQIGQTR